MDYTYNSNLLFNPGGEAINELGIIEQELASIHEAIGHERSGHEMFSHPSPEQMEEAVYSSVQKICSLLTRDLVITKKSCGY